MVVENMRNAPALTMFGEGQSGAQLVKLLGAVAQGVLGLFVRGDVRDHGHDLDDAAGIIAKAAPLTAIQMTVPSCGCNVSPGTTNRFCRGSPAQKRSSRRGDPADG